MALQIDIGDFIKVLFPLKMKFTDKAHFFLASVVWTLSAASAVAFAQGPNPGTATAPSLSAAQIVAAMEGHNLTRASALKHFHSVRHYAVEYRGYSARVAAKMEVEADYDAVSGKSFHIVS